MDDAVQCSGQWCKLPKYIYMRTVLISIKDPCYRVYPPASILYGIHNLGGYLGQTKAHTAHPGAWPGLCCWDHAAYTQWYKYLWTEHDKAQEKNLLVLSGGPGALICVCALRA